MGKNKIHALILAAGQGRRAGLAKLSRYIGEDTMLEHLAKVVSSSNLEKTIMVTGYEKSFAENIAKKYGFLICHNENYMEGMSTSLKAGVRALPEDCQAIVIILGDMPYIKASTINTLVSAFETGEKDIIIPRYKNKTGHPLIMSSTYKEQILNIQGDKGARDVIKNNLQNVKYIDINDEGILIDIDEFNDQG